MLQSNLRHVVTLPYTEHDTQSKLLLLNHSIIGMQCGGGEAGRMITGEGFLDRMNAQPLTSSLVVISMCSYILTLM